MMVMLKSQNKMIALFLQAVLKIQLKVLMGEGLGIIL